MQIENRILYYNPLEAQSHDYILFFQMSSDL